MIGFNKNDTLVFHLDEHTDIPELDTQTANQLLDNVFAACDVEPSVVPVEVLESWGNYKKHGFNLGRTLAYIFLILLILLPLMFFRPSIIAERTDVKSASDAIYSIHIKTLLPLHSVSATINGAPVQLQEEGSKEFKAAVSDNGTLKIKAVSFNGQVAARSYKVRHLDKEKPVLKDSYSKNGYVYLEVMDTYSGIDYPNIGGYAPDHFDTKTGMIVYPVPDEPVTVTIPDNAGNELVLLLSPVDNN